MKLLEPSIADVLAARRRISAHVLRTPVRHYPSLDELLGAEVWVKHENFQVLGAFKVRGGLNLVSQSDDETKRRGFVTASTGNHGQSIAFAARAAGSSAVIYVPVGANPVKVAAMRALGAEVVEHGEIFDDAREQAEIVAVERGMRFVHPANEPDLIAGVGTYSLEIHEDLSGIDCIIVPVGGGSGACGACIVTDTVSPSTRVIGVQAAAAPAVHRSWKSGKPETAEMATAAEGLATKGAYELPVSILKKRLDDFALISEDRFLEAMRLMVEHTRSLVEHAGAAALGAAIEMMPALKGKRVVLVASGANATASQLAAALAR